MQSGLLKPVIVLPSRMLRKAEKIRRATESLREALVGAQVSNEVTASQLWVNRKRAGNYFTISKHDKMPSFRIDDSERTVAFGEFDLHIDILRAIEILYRNSSATAIQHSALSSIFLSADILICTPGMLTKMLAQGLVNLSGTTHVVVDEADLLLDDLFLHVVLHILRTVKTKAPGGAQLIFSCSVFPKDVHHLTEAVCETTIDIVKTEHVHRLMPHVNQKFIRLTEPQKPEKILELVRADLAASKSVLVFVKDGKTCYWLKSFLSSNGISAECLSGSQTAFNRQTSYLAFLSRTAKVLIATDLAARGLDIPHVAHVICYNSEGGISAYIQRAGRVGRLGSLATAHVTSFISRKSEIELAQLVEARFTENMPRSSAESIVYPSGVLPFGYDMKNPTEFLKRLKHCADELQEIPQLDAATAAKFKPLALHLATEPFMTDKNKEVRILVACCIADILRIFAPDPPYTDLDHLRCVMQFLISQLRCLDKVEDPYYSRAYYLLDNLASVKSMSIVLPLDDSQDLVCDLFKMLFTVINPGHDQKVYDSMLELMLSLLMELDVISVRLMDTICSNLLEPRKTQNREAYSLASHLISRFTPTLETAIELNLNTMLLVGKESESELCDRVYDLIFELYTVSSHLLNTVLPQLELKIKSSEENEREGTVRLLGRLFALRNGDLISEHPNLWECFLGRFNDISVAVRLRCVRICVKLLQHSQLRRDILEALMHRVRDPDDGVRFATISTVITATDRGFHVVSSKELLDCLRERTLDKKFKVRKIALQSIGKLYKKFALDDMTDADAIRNVAWVKNKILHMYYQASLEDRLLCERIVHSCLVPFSFLTKHRMEVLLELYATVDDNALKAFNEMVRQQHVVRCLIRQVIEAQTQVGDNQSEETVKAKLRLLSEHFIEPLETFPVLLQFQSILLADKRAFKLLQEIFVCSNHSCETVDGFVKELLAKLSQTKHRQVSVIVKQLLERAAPVSIDAAAIKELAQLVRLALLGRHSVANVQRDVVVERGLYLLMLFACSYSPCFHNEETLECLMEILSRGQGSTADITIQIFGKISSGIETAFPQIATNLTLQLRRFCDVGTPRQAKHALQCLHDVVSAKEEHMQVVLESCKSSERLHISHVNISTTLATLSGIARLCPQYFGRELKLLLGSIIVPKIILHNGPCHHDDNLQWLPIESLAAETKAKIASVKFVARLLLGLMSNDDELGTKSLKLLVAIIEKKGELKQGSEACDAENAWLRLAAGCAVLKLARERFFANLLTVSQYVVLASLITDETPNVRIIFARKLHRGLSSLKLGVEYLAIYGLAPLLKSWPPKNDETVALFLRDMHNQLFSHVIRRRDYLKKHPAAQQKPQHYMAEYAVAYAIYILAHHPRLTSYNDAETLDEFRNCLWFLMEPLTLLKLNERASFEFLFEMCQTVKQSKDAAFPEDNGMNYKIWALCDLGMTLITYRVHNFTAKSKDVKSRAVLSRRFYVEQTKQGYNTKVYLPDTVIEGEKIRAKERKLKEEAGRLPLVGLEPALSEQQAAESESSDAQSSGDEGGTATKQRKRRLGRARLPSESAAVAGTSKTKGSIHSANGNSVEIIAKGSSNARPAIKASKRTRKRVKASSSSTAPAPVALANEDGDESLEVSRKSVLFNVGLEAEDDIGSEVEVENNSSPVKKPSIFTQAHSTSNVSATGKTSISRFGRNLASAFNDESARAAVTANESRQGMSGAADSDEISDRFTKAGSSGMQAPLVSNSPKPKQRNRGGRNTVKTGPSPEQSAKQKQLSKARQFVLAQAKTTKGLANGHTAVNLEAEDSSSGDSRQGEASLLPPSPSEPRGKRKSSTTVARMKAAKVFKASTVTIQPENTAACSSKETYPHTSKGLRKKAKR